MLNQTLDTIKQWEERNLSITGKTLLAKTVLLSNFAYIMQDISLLVEVLNNIDQIIYEFIWKRQFTDKKAFEKVKRAVVNADIEWGGLIMISAKDMQKVFQINWVKKNVNKFKLGNETL